MCPNCYPSLGMSAGYAIAFFICILFFGVGVLAMVLASRSGRMNGIEDTKYSMLED